MLVRRSIFFELLLLELMCYVPLVIIAGNIFPPIGPLKIHWIYIGVVFLLTLLLFVKNRRLHGFLLLICSFVGIQIMVANEFYIKDFIDFMSGPMLFILVVNMVCYSTISRDTFDRYRKKFLVCAAVPIGIAFLQFVKVMPLEILNANYVNVTIFGSEKIERVNGFLFHGIELAVIIFFFFANIGLFRSGTNAYVVFLIMIGLEFMTRIKSGIMSSVVYLGFFTYFIDKKYRIIKASAFGIAIVLGLSSIYVLIPDIKFQRLNFDAAHFKFPGQLFTGRGYIWNVYLKGLRQIDIWQTLFGYGFGSAPGLFKQNSELVSVTKVLPGPHNQFLEFFINGGLFAIWFIFYILSRQYNKLKRLFNRNKTVLNYYLGVILIPLVMMGLTAPIMSMFIYWCSLSMFIVGLKLKFTDESA
jgi:hypothetical protein